MTGSLVPAGPVAHPIGLAVASQPDADLVEADFLDAELVDAELVDAEVLDAEVLDPAALAVLADRVAQAQAAPNTRRAYAATYRQLETLLILRLGRTPTPADLTPETVVAFRDALEAAGRQPTTIARHLAAVRQLLDAAGADPAARRVRGPRVGPTDPRPLAEAEYARLLAMPDRRTVRGRRDLAILYALGDAGLRRAMP